MTKNIISYVSILSLIILLLNGPNAYAKLPDYENIINFESKYLANCATSTGAMIMGPDVLYAFKGGSYYKICPYFSNFAAVALLDNPTKNNIQVVKNWIIWVFNHLNADGSIYDYYTNKINGGTDYASIEALPDENIPDYDSQDSYAATFLTLLRSYAETVPEEIPWLNSYSAKIELVGRAIYAVTDDSTHKFSGDNNDGLCVAKPSYQVKYTMDNSEVYEGLKDMVWLQHNVVTPGNEGFYTALLNKNIKGFANLWYAGASMFYSYEGAPKPNWDVFYPDATCQLFPVWTGALSQNPSRAKLVYDAFNSHYPDWHIGKSYGTYPWTIICYTAAVMNDTLRVNSYLSIVESYVKKGTHLPYWFNMESAFVIRSAKRMQTLSGVSGSNQSFPRTPMLRQNYPNPFNPSTTITYSVPSFARVNIIIYNLLGQKVKTLVNEYQNPGDYSIFFNAAELSGGIYICKLQSGNYFESKKLVLLK